MQAGNQPVLFQLLRVRCFGSFLQLFDLLFVPQLVSETASSSDVRARLHPLLSFMMPPGVSARSNSIFSCAGPPSTWHGLP